MARGKGSLLNKQYLRDYAAGSLMSYNGPNKPMTQVVDDDQAIAIALREQEEEEKIARLKRQGMRIPASRYKGR